MPRMRGACSRPLSLLAADSMTRHVEKVPCPECKEKGSFTDQAETVKEKESTCGRCYGLGRIGLHLCPLCRGDGKIREVVKVEAIVRKCSECGGHGYLVQIVEITEGHFIDWQCSACGGAGGRFAVPYERSQASRYEKCGACGGEGKRMRHTSHRRIVQPPSRLDGG
jgi:DnaJ-class molecular chaperone